jgi:hypothetical protein
VGVRSDGLISGCCKFLLLPYCWGWGRGRTADNGGKSKLSANYPAENFSVLRKVKISLFKCLSLLLEIILDRKLTICDQYYLRFGRKNSTTKNMM